MKERFASGFDPFVLPFLLGMIFVLGYCAYGIVRILLQLPRKDRRRFLLSLITPHIILKNVWDIFCNCLLHVKLWKRNKMLGFMHSSIAFGWFMLILLGHIEVMAYCPDRIRFFYYPIFFNYFVAENESTIGGAVLFFLMDFFLLMILTGIVLAVVKRVRSRIFGMRRTTRLSLMDNIGLYSLWAIFPLRLLAESFTAHISGGSFLTIPANWVFRQFLGNDLNMLPTWWAYSIALGVFMCVLPFTRYMHIPAEMMLIPMRNAGLRIRHPRKGFARIEVLSCPGCGVCIDACPMSVKKANIKDCTVYLNRQIRRGNEKRIEEISDKCLLCGKCEAVCQVGVEGPLLRMEQRAMRKYGLSQDFSGLDVSLLAPAASGAKVLYFSGCMTRLTPSIGKSVTSVLHKAGVGFRWMDEEGGLCCGRPLQTAGRYEQAAQLIRKNEELILGSGADTLVLSCPICYKIFSQDYKLPGVRVVNYATYFSELIASGRLNPVKSDICYVYHDPCESGRGCGYYDEPRKLLGAIAGIAEAPMSRSESVCCGGSLGSLTLEFAQREAMTRKSLENLYASRADAVATACPLCLATFSRYSERPVRDLSEILDLALKSEKASDRTVRG
ncbi:MAG: (Fe-S)-binding protein [Bacteroidales bacterium]|nr:(Fe-S)-binding protein [Bacteroidales bacterium]